MIEDDIFKIEVPLDDSYSADMDLHPVENTSNTAKSVELSGQNTDPNKTSLSETQEKIIKLIKDNPKISAQKISETLGISSRAIEKQIKELKERNILSRTGSKKDGRWVFESR